MVVLTITLKEKKCTTEFILSDDYSSGTSKNSL